MDDNAEEAFVAQYEPLGPVRMIARRVYRELHPKGMHTNGPCRVEIDATTLQYLLKRWLYPSTLPVTASDVACIDLATEGGGALGAPAAGAE